MLVVAGGHVLGLELVSRETFQGVGTLDSVTPGNLGAVSGSFYKRPIGPRPSGDTTVGSRGWSADNHNTAANGRWALAGGLGSAWNGMICGWFFFGDIQTDGVTGRNVQLLAAMSGSGNGQIMADIEIGNTLAITRNSSFATTSPASPVALTKGTWVFVALAWVYTPATYDTTTFRAYYQLPGGTLTQLGTDITGASGMQNGLFLYSGIRPSTGNISVEARMGCLSQYAISSFADMAVPSDVVAPPAGPFDWYLNPATGSDNNDGTTAATAWATDSKFNVESQYLGMIPSAAGMGSGDVLHLDCAGAPLPIGSAGLSVKTRGLTILQTGGALDPMTTLAADGWSPVSGAANVYQSTDGGSADMVDVVIFEAGKYLNHPTGANLAAVQASLVATPGSFWTDGTTLYLHPFGDTDPRIDGKTYRRTRNRGVAPYLNSAGSAVVINAPDVWWDGLICAGTTLARKTDNNRLGAYCFQWDAGAGGTNLLSNFSVDHFSKHGVGRTCGGSNGTFTRQDGTYGQASPYGGFGGSSADVDFSGDATSANNVGNYVRCMENVNVGVIGSAAGMASPSTQFWTSHASGVAFREVNVTDCRLKGYFSEQGVTGQMNLQRSTLASIGTNCPLTATECQTTFGGLSTGQGKLTLRNCLLKISATPGDYQFASLGGSADIANCTFDLRGNRLGSYATTAVWGRGSGSDSRTIRIWNSVLLVDADKNFTLLQGFNGTADTLDINHNIYQLGANGFFSWVAPSSPSTFAQWRDASGQDLQSQVALDAGLDAAGRPGYGSLTIDAGVDLGPATDLDATRVFSHRRTAGAYEFKPTFDLWRDVRYPDPAQRGDPTVAGLAADPDGNGWSNLLEFALGLSPFPGHARVTPPVAAVEQINGRPRLTLTYHELENPGDLSYEPEASTDLLTWRGGDEVIERIGAIDLGGGVQLVTVRALESPVGNPAPRFLRLRVNYQETAVSLPP